MAYAYVRANARTGHHGKCFARDEDIPPVTHLSKNNKDDKLNLKIDKNANIIPIVIVTLL
jgi:hypothetical protein